MKRTKDEKQFLEILGSSVKIGIALAIARGVLEVLIYFNN